MKNIENIRLNSDATIKEALRIIDKAALQIALIVDKDNNLIGTLTDGDVRRGLLKGLTLKSPIKAIVCTNPTIAKISDTKEYILKLALSKKLRQIPIVNESLKVIGIEEIDELVKPKTKSNKVFLMVGGLGTRLRPLTENTPKPMLKVGNKPILQTIIEKFTDYGYKNFVMCMNYKFNTIKNYFKQGEDLGVNIEYILEDKRMGTAGALSLIKEKPVDSFFVINGDILTNVNFEYLHSYHKSNNSIATMCVRTYDFQVPYGVINIKNSRIISVKEKPIQKCFVSAGIYILSPEVLEYVPRNEFFDMPTLFEKLIADKKNVTPFPLREYWLDIGRIEEYKKANEDYLENF